jgi:outer membrane immunogenic protein
VINTRSSFSDVLEDELGTSGVDLDADLFQLRASYRF